MSNVKNYERYALVYQDHVKELRDFFSEIEGISSLYEYVAVAERRGFNLFYAYCPNVGNMCSFSGLLLQYKEIAAYYRESGGSRFPRILLVDDVLFHGRGLARLVSHLEELLFKELKPSAAEDVYLFQRNLARAIEIRIYARNYFPVFLDERFLQRTHWRKRLFGGELRDMSMQLTNEMLHQEVADTSFVPSIRLGELSASLIARADSNETTAGDWKLISWIYQGERMILACRLFGDKFVNRISTIRFFPSRSKDNKPWISSYTVLGKFKKDVLNVLCERTSAILDPNNEGPLSAILHENEPILQHSKGQVLCYFVSAIDLLDFIESTKLVDFDSVAAADNDLGKIMCNFGGNEAIRSYLNAPLVDSGVRTRLKAALYPILEQEASPIWNIRPEQCFYEAPRDEIAAEKEYDLFNDLVQDIFYRVGIESEGRAFSQKGEPYLFHAETYQDYQDYYAKATKQSGAPDYFWQEEYRENSETLLGRDGVITPSDFSALASREAMKKGIDAFEYVYQFLASYIMMMDIGIMGNMLQISRRYEDFVVLAKSGELSTCYFPQKMAAFVPALAMIEECYYRVGITEKSAVVAFYDSMREKLRKDGKAMTEDSFNPNEVRQWQQLIESLPETKVLGEYTDMLYRAGQTFGGWNFPNLCYPNYSFLQKCQQMLLQKAREFLGAAN